MKNILEVLDTVKLKKSDGARKITDKIYNVKNQRSSLVSKKSEFTFDIDKVKFQRQLPALEEGPDGKRGENSIAGTDLNQK